MSVPASDTKSPDLSLSRSAVMECRKICSETKQALRPFLLFADTEGMAYVHQFSVQSLDDSYEMHCDITAPAEYKRAPVQGSVSMSSVWERLDADMEAAGHSVVYILFHNGAAHDEKLLVEQAQRENSVIPARFKFGDSLLLLKQLFPPTSLKSWSMQSVYLAFVGESIHDKAKGQNLKQHSAYYDTTQLRMVFRFVAAYISKYLSQKPSAPLYTVALAQAELMPAGALGPAAVDIMCRAAAAIADWRALKVTPAPAPAPAATPPQTKKNEGDVSKQQTADGAQAAVVAATPNPKLNSNAVWISKNGRMRHTRACPALKRSKTVYEITDLSVLDLLPYCQKCAAL